MFQSNIYIKGFFSTQTRHVMPQLSFCRDGLPFALDVDLAPLEDPAGTVGPMVWNDKCQTHSGTVYMCIRPYRI